MDDLRRTENQSMMKTTTDKSTGTVVSDCNCFTFVLYVGVFGVLCLFGLIGNTLSFAVLRWERHCHVATFLLQVMACADNLFLTTTGFSQMFIATAFFLNDTLNPLTAYIRVCVWPLVHITQMWTVWITVLVAVNRYIAICRPFQAALWCTMTHARRHVVVLAVVIVFYNLPRFFEYRIESREDTIYAAESIIQESRIYNILYENVLYCCFVFLGPLLILVVLNVGLVKELVLSRRRLRALQLPGVAVDVQEQNLTLVMIIIILLFVACQTPAFLNQLLYYAIADTEYSCGRLYYYYYHVSNIVVSANSSVNFVIYCVFRRQFRERLTAFCRRNRYFGKHSESVILNTVVPNRTSSPLPPPSPPPRHQREVRILQ